ncbi:winged helix-turn-helix domain-containing protein [Candidatus Enterococcus moelleringii]
MMQHALVLTKNTLSEEEIIKKLQQLNFETLCSADLLDILQQTGTASVLSYFQWVILSESLCDEEVEQLLFQLYGHTLVILRLTESYPSEEEEARWQNLGLTDWLLKTSDFSSMREKINVLQKQLPKGMPAERQILNFPISNNADTSNEQEALMKCLSKTEKKVFENLVEAYPRTDILSRKELCESLWRSGETASNMSQLSCLINKLKRKFEQQGITGETITTLWGRGYKLSDEFYEYWMQCTQQAERIAYYSATN